MVKVAIIIVNWNQPKLTLDTINSISKITHPNFNYHIFLIDNGSTDNSIEEFTTKLKNDKNISIYHTGSNLGYVGGNNYGLKIALDNKYDYFLCANNDIIVKPNFLTILVNELINHSDIGVVGPKIYFAPGHEYHHSRYKKDELGKVIWSVGGIIDWNNIYGSNRGIDEVDIGQYEQSYENLDFISGCCFLTTKDVLKKVGLFDNKLFMYFEDVDFCQKVKRLGLKLKYIPKSIIWHINSGSSSAASSLQEYFITRNRLLFGFRYAGLRTKFALSRQMLHQLFSSPKWEKQAIIDFLTHKWGKGSWT